MALRTGPVSWKFEHCEATGGQRMMRARGTLENGQSICTFAAAPLFSGFDWAIGVGRFGFLFRRPQCATNDPIRVIRFLHGR